MNSPASSAASRPAIAIIAEPTGAWHDLVNHRSFSFRHSLVGHPLFDLPRLARLGADRVRQHGPGAVLCAVAESVPNVRKQWLNFSPVEKIDNVIANIRESGSWVNIKDAQFDPEYAALLSGIIDELERVSSMDLRRQLTWAEVSVFIGSPNSVTHYHIDSETNFLFQIHGKKEAHLYDQSDRSVISEEEIEQFMFGNINAASLRADAQSTLYDFSPGTGIHIPVTAPHWVRNLDDYSVSLSILLYLKPMDVRSHVYQVNHMIRHFGLRPVPPGISPLRDGMKAAALNLFASRHPESRRAVLHSGLDRVKAIASKLNLRATEA